MKKLMVLAIAVFGMTTMVNAQEAAKAPAKEVKTVKHHKKTKVTKAGDEKKVETTSKSEMKTKK